MAFTIAHVVDEKLAATETWNGSFAEAKAFADAAVAGDSNLRIEILHENGSLLSNHPRVLRVAS